LRIPRGSLTQSTARPPKVASRLPFYYGWVVAGVITATGYASAVIINPTLSIFVKPITTEFQWDRSVFAAAATIGTLLGGVLALGVGPIVDRFGARWVLFIAFAMMGTTLVVLGNINGLVQFYAAIILSRMLLQGIINLTSSVVVAKWFVRMRGQAMALTNLGQRLGGATIPLLAQLVTDRFGWRSAATSLGILSWATTLVPVLLWLRRQPQDMGLAPDGLAGDQAQERPEQASRRPSAATEVSFTLGETLRTPTFYLLLVAFSAFTFVNTGILFNLIPLLTDRGLTTTSAVAILTTWSVVGMPATVGVAFLVDKLPLRYILMIAYAGSAMGVLILTQATTPIPGFLFAALHGWFFAIGLFLQNLVPANYYGPASLGSIRGVLTPLLMVSNAMGPLAATLVFDLMGDYAPLLWVDLGLLATMSAAMFLARPPRRH